MTTTTVNFTPDYIPMDEIRTTMNRKKSTRCSHELPVDWPGHGMAVLKYKRCRNKTLHETGVCHIHRIWIPLLP